MKSSPSTALSRIEQRLDLYAQDPALQRIWLNLESEDWRSLAVIPAGEASTIELVHGLAAVAWQQRGTRLIVADLRTITINTLQVAREELRRRVGGGERVMIAAQSLDKSPSTIAIAREADKALLCIYAGQTSRDSIRNTTRELGLQRCLGTVIVRS